MKGTLYRILFALLLIALVVLIAAVVFVYRDAWVATHSLSAALKGARKVVLVEYSGDVEIARRIATLEEMSRLQKATNVWFRPFVQQTYLCFEPHHRIEIIRADSSEISTDICFLCNNFVIENGPPLTPLPSYLGERLASFFTSVGMTPKTQDEYRTIEIAERSRQSKRTENRLE